MSELQRLEMLLEAHEEVCREIELHEQLDKSTSTDDVIRGVKEARNRIERLIFKEAGMLEDE